MAWSPTRASPAACSAWPASPDLLPGATANRGLVVRVGDTVVRPIAPCWRATHALLAHLAAAGFDGAPRVLGAGAGTEVLTYMHGQAAVPPLPPDTLSDAALVSIAALLRALPPRRGLLRPRRVRLAPAHPGPVPHRPGQPQRRAPGQRDLPRRPRRRADRL